MTQPLYILFGTETGNAEELAQRTFERATKEEGLDAEIKNVADIAAEDLGNYQYVLIVISTWGDGDPPSEAEEFCNPFYEEAPDEALPSLSQLKYTVLALGDQSYEDFCGCGRRIDEGLGKAGAQRFMERQELDVDFEDDYEAWGTRFFDRIKEVLAASEAMPAQEVTTAEPLQEKKAAAPAPEIEKAAAPSVCSRKPDHLIVFVRGADNHLWCREWDGQQWQPWQDLGGELATAPTCVSSGPERIDCFAQGLDKRLWHKWWTPSQWSEWEVL